MSIYACPDCKRLQDFSREVVIVKCDVESMNGLTDCFERWNNSSETDTSRTFTA